VSKKT